MTTPTVRYVESFDAHVIAFLAAEFNITVKHCTYTREFNAWYGDYDLDCGTGTANSAFLAAVDWAAGHNGILFDVLADIEAGA